MHVFEPHSRKQDEAILSNHPILGVFTGIQWGKSTVGAVKTKMKMHEFTDSKDNFIVTAPTYKVLKQATLPTFLAMMEGCGTYHKTDACYSMTGGGTCWFRTNKEPDSIVGIPNVRFVWGDEAGLYSLYFWENIQARASRLEAQICLTSSPYSLNWCYKDLIKPKIQTPEKFPDIKIIRARSNESPYFPDREYQRKKRTMDPRRFNMVYGGSWEKMEGLVYACFSEEENICKPKRLPPGTKFYGGIDWGTTNPFVLKVRAVTPQGYHYQVAEFYKTGLTITDMILAAGSLKSVWNIDRFYADPSEPGYIKEFNRAGLTCIGANNDIRTGIDLHYQLIKSRKFQIFEGQGHYTIDEYNSYHYPTPKDLQPDQDEKNDLPVKQNDHAMDADRYLTISLVRSHKKRTPKAQRDEQDLDSMTNKKRIKLLKRRPKVAR